jgi:hypothetical protein
LVLTFCYNASSFRHKKSRLLARLFCFMSLGEDGGIRYHEPSKSVKHFR